MQYRKLPHGVPYLGIFAVSIRVSLLSWIRSSFEQDEMTVKDV